MHQLKKTDAMLTDVKNRYDVANLKKQMLHCQTFKSEAMLPDL